MRFFRTAIVLLSVLVVVGLLGYRMELALPATAPNLNNTYTPITQSAPKGVGSFDVLGHAVDINQAAKLLHTEAGQQQLSAENGAIAITEDLLKLGRKAFYTETFGNEVFLTDITGALDGPITLPKMVTAIAALGGKPTTNLQIRLDEAVTVGGQTFPAGTVLNTGLDVPARSLIPLGITTHIKNGKVQVGITCAACHAAVDEQTGKILEGAPNTDLDTGLILAMASNSAAWFRQTGVNPLKLPQETTAYVDAQGQTLNLPNTKTFEDAVDADFLSWPPGNFDSTGDLRNDPSQIPSSYTHDAYPYGWNGFASIGWFHGLTTLNSNVHAVNSDLTTGADASPILLGIDKEVYLGSILRNAANPNDRLPDGATPSQFIEKIDPTPGTPGFNQVVPMPGYPKGSLFILDGLMANSPGQPIGQQLNGMSAWQNTLAPPPNPTVADAAVIQHGAKVFEAASCVSCHSGPYFTNHRLVAQAEIGTQPIRAKSTAAFSRLFGKPQTYPSSIAAPLPPDPPVLDIPTDLTPQNEIELAYTINNAFGGYKVPSLIGLAVTAPYLHDGGVAASRSALKQQPDGFYAVADRNEMGLAGTAMRNVPPDPAASLRVLVDRNLRQEAIAANRQDDRLQNTFVEGIGHSYWVDQKGGYTSQDQSDLIQFLLSLDDHPDVFPGEPIAQW